ncbi:hypothetical protein V2E29_04665 [Streptomyces diastatochromogenes]|uniref:hypothetical protein n=1 Tax=Streptomyces diastatochromogenes TaxID=42236 RepID=UPI002F2693D3
MSITKGQQVTGHITNPSAGRVEFAGTVTNTYRSGRQALVNVACDDGIERSALEENVTVIPKNLTPNMVRTLGNLVRHGEVTAEGTQAMNEAGCTYPALQALVRRGLAEIAGTGERRPRFDGGTYEPKVFRPTAAGRAEAK